MSEWRFRCPEGHASIQIYVNRYLCRACNRTYTIETLTDLKEP